MGLSQKERRRHNFCIRTHRNLGNLSAMFDGILIELFWAPGTLKPADLSSKTHANLAAVLNSSFYRSGHKSYSSHFPPEEAILFATVHAGVFKFRGLTSLGDHTSHCNYCSSEFSKQVVEILVHHTEVLGEKSETSSHDGTFANHILKADHGETASLKQRSGETVFGKQFYLALLARFSSIDHLIIGLAAIICRVRKIPRENAGIWNYIKRQVWEKMLRSSQLYFPPKYIKQLIPEMTRAGVLCTKKRLSSYGLVKFHQVGWLGI